MIMAAIIQLVSVVYLVIIVSCVESGRFPYEIQAIKTVKDFPDDNYKSDSFEENFSAVEDDDNAGYITDVQIDELQKAQEKLHQHHEIYRLDPRCPRFNGVCTAPPCASDSECGDKICCFNGCVQTCVEDTSPPIAVDWIEKLVKSTTKVPNTITIPGGCKMTQGQRKSLDLFFKYGHVSKCLCTNDDVVCHVQRRSPWSSSNTDFDVSVDEEELALD